MTKNASIFIFIFSIYSLVSFGQDTAKIGHRFYIKTEIWNTALRAMFVKPTYDIDIQATFRLSNHLHFVNTYGKTTFYLVDQVESTLRPGVYYNTERIGTSFHRSSSMIRYYPFNNNGDWTDFLFVEGGYHFQLYKGTTNGNVYDTTKKAFENEYQQKIDLYRHGPQINLGMSYYFDNDKSAVKSKVIFSPEFFIGIFYNQVYIIKDDFNNIIGTMPYNGYSEPKFRPTFRIKFGIGIL